MLLHILVDACVILLIQHAELDLLCLCRNDQVECVAQYGGVRDAVDSGEVEECEGFLEAIEDADGGKEQIACIKELANSS